MASTDAASEESPAKRRKITERKSLREVPADDFVRSVSFRLRHGFKLMAVSKIDYFRGPEVMIHAGTRDYKLPKLLVTHYSAFFDKAFNDNFKEGEEQETRLDLGTSDAFELAIQWIYNGKIVLPEEAMTSSGIITRLVDFLRLADGVDLLDPLPLSLRVYGFCTHRHDKGCSQHTFDRPYRSQLATLFEISLLKPILDHT